MKLTKKSKITAASASPVIKYLTHEYAAYKHQYLDAKDAYEQLRETDNNDVISRESKMWIAKGQMREAKEALAAELAAEFDRTYTDFEDREAVYNEMYARLRDINKEGTLGLSGSEMDFIVQDALKRVKFNVGSSRKVTAASDWYFGKEKAEKFGDLIVKKLAGKTVSKRKDKAEEPGGLIFEADRIGIDMWDLLEALEGLCYQGRAREIDDSTYKVFADVEGAAKVRASYVIKVKNKSDGYNYQGCGGRSLVKIDSDNLDVFDTREEAEAQKKTYKRPSRVTIVTLEDAREHSTDVEGTKDIVCSEAKDNADKVEYLLREAAKMLGYRIQEWTTKNDPYGPTETAYLLVDENGDTVGMLQETYETDVLGILYDCFNNIQRAKKRVAEYLQNETQRFDDTFNSPTL